MFPPLPSSNIAAQLASAARFLPHLNDAGGFYVATFRRVARRFPIVQVNQEPNNDCNPSLIMSQGRVGQHGHSLPDPLALSSIFGFYGILATAFTTEDPASAPFFLVAESNIHGVQNRIGVVSHRLATALHSTSFVDDRGGAGSFKLISAGKRVFQRLEKKFMTKHCPCRWRPTQEGASFLAPLMKKRIIRLPHKELVQLIGTGILSLLDLEKADGPGLISCDDTPGGVIVGCATMLQKEVQSEPFPLDDWKDVYFAGILSGKGLIILASQMELAPLLALTRHKLVVPSD